MDIAKEQTEISDRIRRVPSSDARERLEAELSSLVAQYSAATTPEARAPIEARLAQFRRNVEIASGVSLWSLATMVFVGFVTFVYLLGIFLYMRGIGSDRYASIEATRLQLREGQGERAARHRCRQWPRLYLLSCFASQRSRAASSALFGPGPIAR